MVLSRRYGALLGICALAASLCLHADGMTAATEPSERTISFYHIHTQESLTVVYKRNGEYVPDAMKQINHIMRDWRKNEEIAIAPATIDLAWEMHEELGSKEPINIICGFRSRATNEMLRRTVGGQASQSQHITGKAIDITFPDIPLKKMRYSALIRERGGVGYYPTSGVPFVHVDTANVRMWPRMPRYELALLFPNGHSKLVPDDGRPITPADVKVAQSKYSELASQVAEFFRDRLTPGATMVASVTVTKPKPRVSVVATLGLGKTTDPKSGDSDEAPALARKVNVTAEPDPALAAPKPFAPATVASLDADDDKPALLATSKPAVGPSAAVKKAAPSMSDRSKLQTLVTVAANTPMHELVSGPKPAVRPQKALAAEALAEANTPPPQPTAQVASLDPATGTNAVGTPDGFNNGWAQAPAFDEDHPDEMDYRPFALAPLLQDKFEARDQPLAQMQNPDVAATLNALDDTDGIIPMKLRQSRQLAEIKTSHEFVGKAVHLDALLEIDRSRLPASVATRTVLTSAR